jgi:hypothetical protein
MKAPEILDKAAQHMRDRAATYDKPEGERSMGLTVAIFNLYHGTNLTESQGWHLMQILKDVRLFARPGYHADSAEDCTAYSALKAEAMALQQESDHAAHAPVVVPPPPEYAPESVAIDDGLIEWGGGECPVAAGTQVEVKYRDNSKFTGFALEDMCLRDTNWIVGYEDDPAPHHADIIAYRVIKKA